MARSLIRENQAEDSDFISNAEHNDPSEIAHTFLMGIDTPATYSGSRGKVLLVNDEETGIDFVDSAVVQSTHEYPRYYIEEDITINVNPFGQYLIEEIGYIEVAGTLELSNGGMLIIK